VLLLWDLLLHCRLQELPATIGALLDLKALFVGHNQLQQLPGSISRLQLLNTLHAGESCLQ
jgi:Leucine-rich repeat (LRR) protein